MRKSWLMTASRVAMGVLLLAGPALAMGLFNPLPGAIFTTLPDGSRVNANIYESKDDVYLDGGPGPNAPQTAAGLPDGDYYFQVTDPSGKVLLSEDIVARRQFRVTGGIISGLSGAGDHVTGIDVDHGAITVQLMPYLDTPNNGGVYKVWVTPVADFTGDPNQVDNVGWSGGNAHGFIPSCSKVDTFKVRVRGGKELPCLKVVIYKDRNLDGFRNPTKNSGEWDFPKIEVRITDSTGAQLNGPLFTGYDGDGVQVCNLTPGTYTVEFVMPPQQMMTGATLDGVAVSYPVTVNMSDRNRLVEIGLAFCADM